MYPNRRLRRVPISSTTLLLASVVLSFSAMTSHAQNTTNFPVIGHVDRFDPAPIS